jgi:hypothetical protein
MREMNSNPASNAACSRASSLRGFAVALALLIALAAGCGHDPLPAAPAVTTLPGTGGEAGNFPRSLERSFSDWKAACDLLPHNRALRLRPPPNHLLPLKTFREFADVMEAFFAMAAKGPLAESGAWLGQSPARETFFNIESAYFAAPPLPFEPFVQRLLVPPGSQIMIRGDLHGDIHSLIAWIDWLNQHNFLDGFQIARPDVYLLFLGDFTDRGMYGLEVLYTVLRLKLENPDRVLLLRGNHEDVSLAARYGFIAEGNAKYGRDFDAQRVLRLYDFFPVALYLACEANAVQCNHGGLEPGFDPRPLLDAPEFIQFQFLGSLRQETFLQNNQAWARTLAPREQRLAANSLMDFQPATPTTPSLIGFMWNDFTVVPGEPDFQHDPARAFVYGQRATKYFLEHSSGAARQLQAVFRAHQHSTVLNPLMQRLKISGGVFRHWQENDSPKLLNANPSALAAKLDGAEVRLIPPHSVWTFNVSPDTVYGEGCGFDFDSFGILATAANFGDWRLRVVNLLPGE